MATTNKYFLKTSLSSVFIEISSGPPPLAFKNSISSPDLMKKLRPILESISEQISNKIKTLELLIRSKKNS
jgi:hypothetical protein